MICPVLARAAESPTTAAANRANAMYPSLRPMPTFKRIDIVKFAASRSIRAMFRLADLEPDDCRYPYGGDEEGELLPCGHPRRPGQALRPHYLTCGPGTASERSAGTVLLQLVEAA